MTTDKLGKHFPDHNWPSPPPAPAEHFNISGGYAGTHLDGFDWLRNLDDPETKRFLADEEQYACAVFARNVDLQKQLFQEMSCHLRTSDVSVSAHKGNYAYYTRTTQIPGAPVYYRRQNVGEGEAGVEEAILDVSELVRLSPYCRLGRMSISPDERLLAYLVDWTGDEVYELRIRDVAAGIDLVDRVENVSTTFAWANDNQTLFYTRPDSAFRPWQVLRHRIGVSSSDDVLYEEENAAFFLELHKTKSGEFILLYSESKSTNQVFAMPTHHPNSGFALISPQQEGVKCTVLHHSDRFLILSSTPIDKTLSRKPITDNRRDVHKNSVPTSDTVLIGVDVFQTHLVFSERVCGVPRFRVEEFETGSIAYVEPPVAAAALDMGSNMVFNAPTFQYQYTSLIDPLVTMEYHLGTGLQQCVHRASSSVHYDRRLYTTKMVSATAQDGTTIPITLAYRNDQLQPDAPLLLYGYGAYGRCLTPKFAPNHVSLLDRGFVVGLAHVRGGGEFGPAWHDAGRLLNKRNSFHDFITCTEYLINTGYTTPKRLAIRGGSAGGLLVATALMWRPDLYRAAILNVPFLDMLATLQDDTFPLAVLERDEWGDPGKQLFHDYIASYSPYENIIRADLPVILVTAGKRDRWVGYWQAAKWVAKLRHINGDKCRVVLRIKEDEGHAGASSVTDAWNDEATLCAFLLDALQTT